jgi:hypothetical protein
MRCIAKQSVTRVNKSDINQPKDFKLMKHQLLIYKTKTLVALILFASLTACAIQGEVTRLPPMR